MGRYLGPKGKICRRLGENVFGNDKFARVLARRNYAPGVHGPKMNRRISEYGLQLREKQKARAMYGVMEKQLRKYYRQASSSDVNTGEELLRLLERRLDSVIFRIGLAATRAQARQFVSHGHVLVNGKRMNIPSYPVRQGDTISVRPKSRELTIVKDNVARQRTDLPAWLDFDPQELTAKVVHLPEGDDLGAAIDSKLIIEYYSR